MATKTITITEEAYRRLAHLKAARESFSDTITRIAGSARLSELHDVLSRKVADALESAIEKGRQEHRKARAERTKKTIGAFS
jgi:predicted CopG family antitoxin